MLYSRPLTHTHTNKGKASHLKRVLKQQHWNCLYRAKPQANHTHRQSVVPMLVARKSRIGRGHPDYNQRATHTHTSVLIQNTHRSDLLLLTYMQAERTPRNVTIRHVVIHEIVFLFHSAFHLLIQALVSGSHFLLLA